MRDGQGTDSWRSPAPPFEPATNRALLSSLASPIPKLDNGWMTRGPAFCLSAAAAFCVCLRVAASTVPIVNAGFEDPVLGAGQQNGPGYDVPGWVEYDEEYPWAFDIFNPDTGTIVAQAHSGQNVLLSLAYRPATQYVELQLAASLELDMRYTLSAWVADPDAKSPLNNIQLMLFAGTSLLGAATVQPATAGTWTNSCLVLETTNSHPQFGQPLKVRLMWGDHASYRVLVDDVALDATRLVTNSPSAPASLAAANFGATAIDLAWIPAQGVVEGYRLERALPGEGFEFLASLPATSTTFRDTCLPASSTFTYRITATNVIGSSPAASVVAKTAAEDPGAIPGPAFTNVRDFGYMWWTNGTASPVYAIRTSRYGLLFNTASLTPTALSPLANSSSEASALIESSAQGLLPLPPVKLACRCIQNGGTNAVAPASLNSSDVQLVECGKFFQRRFQKVALAGGPALNSQLSGLEVAAWPDRLSFVLRLAVANPTTNAILEMTLGLTNAYSVLQTSGAGSALMAADGSGFVFLKSSGGTTLTVDPTNALVTVRTAVASWSAGQEQSVGLVIYPSAANVALTLTNAVVGETSPLAMRATGTIPSAGTLTTSYDGDRGYYWVVLPPGGTPGDNGILRVRVCITNTSSYARLARLNFDGVPFYIPGLTAVLRDNDLNPIGIPVQLSKNWHASTPAERFQGEWFHGLTMLTVPANTNLSFELVMVGQNWGGIPSATHSQLSVIGYGGNQQWDEAALGNFGEALCYDVDHVLTDNDCTDSRPMLLLNTNGQTGQWCGNAGGAQFLRYYDRAGHERRHTRMRTQYLHYCPNLAEVEFAGQTDDGTIDLSYSAMLFRSDDYTRGVHRLRVDVRSDASFSRLVFFQQAADTYAYGNGNILAYGNATNLAPLRQWTATFGQNANMGTPVALAGPMPWAMTLNSPADPSGSYAPANRGFTIRSWQARINGVSNVPPYIVERSIPGASLFDLVPPPGATTLKAGDFVEAEIVRFYVPKFASNYYGPNASFHQALTNYQNTCLVGLREAVGNNLTVTPQWGTLERLYPIRIQATNDRAGFTVTGGLGCLPVTFTGLSGYRAPVLEENVGGVWAPLNQGVNGSDFWQCDYNAARGAWEITFTLKLDGTNYLDINALMTAPPTSTFRFRMGGAQQPRFSAITLAPDGILTLLAEGEPGSTIALLTSDSVAVPLLNWAVATNVNTIGNPFTVAVPTANNAPQRFYALRTQ